MSALAIAFKKAGYIVTGSDAGFFPPISTELESQGISFYPGWHAEKMVEHGIPDLVVVGNVASSTNPEWQYVEEHKLHYKSYPETIAEFFIKEHSIVCAGTFGKTSSTTLLSWILTECGLDPSYMFGGLAVNHDFDAAKITQSSYSVVEGDEYKSARWDNRPKFAHYSPTHLLLTGLAWDHADVYPTEAAYFDAFKQLVESIPKSGIIVADTDQEKIKEIVSLSHCPIVSYGKGSGAMYEWTNLLESTQGTTFDIIHSDETYHVESQLLGSFQAANMTGCFAMAHQIGISTDRILSAIKSFRGMRRRLEKRFDGAVTIFDDIAHSPAKAKATLDTLRTIYPQNKLVAVFEPNTGNRQIEAVPQYDHAFASADNVIIPRLTQIKKNLLADNEAMDGKTLAQILQKTHAAVWYIEDDASLVTHIKNTTQKGDVVVFLGSHGFRGMIEELIEQLATNN